MSFINFLRISSGLFKKDVITFLILRRHDLNIFDEKLRYIAVKPTASVSQLRHKVWYLLDLPDYCDEIIILKSESDRELPLTELRKGNDPQHPYILEVWLPNKVISSGLLNNMITMGNKSAGGDNYESPDTVFEEKIKDDYKEKGIEDELCKNFNFKNTTKTATINETVALNKFRMKDTHQMKNKECEKRSDLTCKISTSSIFFKLHGRKSRDNFANILLKIQSDLTTLTNKLSDLENRIQL
ncbi:uncharacterized protein LOC124543652 [Vanessa cardui]|uniref:uncharacterized protein LOC124543652 n=1 Tax=Vanessa cardui TaxID=171605 RepID=UPI001F138ED4|nr:uncharacterized protein LOC124543652 [Vanessa cardui]